MRHPPQNRLAAIALCSSVVFALPHANATEKHKPTKEQEALAIAKVTEAKAFFKNHVYKRAAQRFMEAYAIAKHPTSMYNAARAYQKGKMFSEAVALFREYLSLKNITEDDRKHARERLDDIQKERQNISLAKQITETSDSSLSDNAQFFGSLGIGATSSIIGTIKILDGIALMKDANNMKLIGSNADEEYTNKKNKAQNTYILGWSLVGLGALSFGFSAWKWFDMQPGKTHAWTIQPEYTAEKKGLNVVLLF